MSSIPAATNDSQTPGAGSSPAGKGRASRKRSRLRILLGVLGVVLVVALLAAVLLATPLFAIRSIEVRGNQQVETPVIVEATGIQEGQNLLRIDAAHAAAGVASLPRIQSATTKRSLPSTLVVEVEEKRVVAWADRSGEAVLIDERGQTFTDGTPPPTAVRIAAKDDQETFTHAVEVVAALPPHVAEQVDHIAADGPYNFVLHMKDGRTVVWGAAEDNGNKAVATETVLKREGSTWDVSNPVMPVVR
ncbi:cell division protein FtsQ/DivIB [Corynebacterium tapiri]|uniref:FtsQ-type POTRA domain-containing protein n=1 Tax=Corynebacterium tapiri TaxID=1448266 RepID=A0A5C4U6U4_9CORY|nr:FtsQ-type POTRA domain-containing protein [Corynebacterium tapiri]TNL99395.1 FtsQ-type POTRA domain-containing protein [Corynebacterium tapiri]